MFRILAATFLLVTMPDCSELPEGLPGACRTGGGEWISIRQSGDDALRLRLFDTGETRRFVFADSDHGIVTRVVSGFERRYGNYHRDHFTTQLRVERPLAGVDQAAD